jgi:phage anti-repressor protein/transcriptional regulator of met regulon
MSELIKIELQVIGTEEVNSVNARELHKTLEIKKDFSTWIKNQINSLGLEENVDYIIAPPKRGASSHGGQNAKDYIITTDTAKHISMASRTPKGKEVRSYFIAVEKAAQQNALGGDTNAVMLEMLKNQQRLTDAVLDVINTQQSQNKVIMDYVTATFDGLKSIGHIKTSEIQTLPQYIDSRDRKKLRDAIKEKAKEVAKDLGVSISTISPSIWIELKDFFDVDDYQDILKSQVKDVMHFVMFWEPKKGQKREVEQKVTHEIILDEDGNTRVVPIV